MELRLLLVLACVAIVLLLVAPGDVEAQQTTQLVRSNLCPNFGMESLTVRREKNL